jgi:uncharacterized membrane protein YfcA
MTAAELSLAGLSAVAAGAVNALAGGGTLLTFPTLMALGLPAVAANVTSTVALCPGYLGASLAQSRDLADQAGRMRLLLPAALLGGLAGAVLLLATGETLFRGLAPFLLLLAAGLLAAQEPLKAWVARRGGGAAGAARGEVTTATGSGSPGATGVWAMPLVGLAAVYGGYFGAGVSVVLLAVLALVIDDSLTRLNALKQALALAANLAAALFFVFSGRVDWPAAGVMAVAALAGGALGGRLAGRLSPVLLRRVVVGLGVAAGIIYLVR